MKKLSLLLVLICPALLTFGQKSQETLKPFTKIIASPRINLILKKGDHEDIRLVYKDVSKGKINIVVKGKTLHLYLDNARKIEKTERNFDKYGSSRHGIYEGVSITAYVT